MERARRGDAAAFGLLMRKHAPLVRRVLTNRLGKTDALDDLAQETWLHVYTGLPGLRETGRFAAWLQGIVLNVARLWLREQRAHARLSEALTREGAERARVPSSTAAFCSSVEAMVTAREEQNALFAAMETLPRRRVRRHDSATGTGCRTRRSRSGWAYR